MRRRWFATESNSQGFHLRLPSSRTPRKLPWSRNCCSSQKLCIHTTCCCQFSAMKLCCPPRVFAERFKQLKWRLLRAITFELCFRMHRAPECILYRVDCGRERLLHTSEWIRQTMFLDAQDLREFDSRSGSELPDGDSGRARSMKCARACSATLQPDRRSSIGTHIICQFQ